MFKFNLKFLLLPTVLLISSCSMMSQPKNQAEFNTDLYDVIITPYKASDSNEIQSQFKQAVFDISPLTDNALKEALKPVGTLTIKQKYLLVPSDDNVVPRVDNESGLVSNQYQTDKPLIPKNKSDKDISAKIILTESSDINMLYSQVTTRLGNSQNYTYYNSIIRKGKTYLIEAYQLDKNTFNIMIISAHRTASK